MAVIGEKTVLKEVFSSYLEQGRGNERDLSPNIRECVRYKILN